MLLNTQFADFECYSKSRLKK